ncbi:hypothetical protein GGS26DRAFT_561021 [Hypomontagnella submonticulosa]|nr:hypothetical protein GGS26DRAFT_561021 [Hypomontagnella submonticulosa]
MGKKPMDAALATRPAVQRTLVAIEEQVKRPSWETHVYGLLVPGPESPPVDPRDEEELSMANVSSEDLARQIQTDFVVRDLLAKQDHQQEIVKLIDIHIDSLLRAMIQEIMDVGRPANPSEDITKYVCEDLYSSFLQGIALAIESRDEVANTGSEELIDSLANIVRWWPRLTKFIKKPTIKGKDTDGDDGSVGANSKTTPIKVDGSAENADDDSDVEFYLGN